MSESKITKFIKSLKPGPYSRFDEEQQDAVKQTIIILTIIVILGIVGYIIFS